MDRAKLKIHEVNRNQLWEILSYPAPRGLFLAKSRCKWVAVDNSTGDAWTEEFPRKRQAVRWLRGKFEVGKWHSYSTRPRRCCNYLQTVVCWMRTVGFCNIVCGTFFLCGAPEDSNYFTSLTEDQMQRYLTDFASPEVFLPLGGRTIILPCRKHEGE